MNPPLRTESDRRALIEALRSGVIDCVATDHAPHAPHEKEVPFEQAPMGTTGLETAFAAIYTELVLAGELELAILIERMTAGGALYGLPIPRIAPGEPANVCLIDTEARLDGRRERLRQQVGQLLLSRHAIARQGDADGRGRRASRTDSRCSSPATSRRTRSGARR